jgi:hypothetical protein
MAKYYYIKVKVDSEEEMEKIGDAIEEITGQWVSSSTPLGEDVK